MAIIDILPESLNRFPLDLIVMYTSMWVMMPMWGIWAVYGSLTSNVTQIALGWVMIWSLTNIGGFLGVVLGLNKNVKMFLIPSLFLCPVAIIAGFFIVLETQSIPA